MTNEIEELNQIKLDLTNLRETYPSIYENLEYIASLTRQLSIHYKYQVLLMCSNNIERIRSNRPTIIREPVLKLYEQEVGKVKKTEHFELFKNIVSKIKSISYSQILLIILGAETNFVFNKKIIK